MSDIIVLKKKEIHLNTPLYMHKYDMRIEIISRFIDDLMLILYLVKFVRVPVFSCYYRNFL